MGPCCQQHTNVFTLYICPHWLTNLWNVWLVIVPTNIYTCMCHPLIPYTKLSKPPKYNNFEFNLRVCVWESERQTIPTTGVGINEEHFTLVIVASSWVKWEHVYLTPKWHRVFLEEESLHQVFIIDFPSSSGRSMAIDVNSICWFKCRYVDLIDLYNRSLLNFSRTVWQMPSNSDFK